MGPRAREAIRRARPMAIAGRSRAHPISSRGDHTFHAPTEGFGRSKRRITMPTQSADRPQAQAIPAVRPHNRPRAQRRLPFPRLNARERCELNGTVFEQPHLIPLSRSLSAALPLLSGLWTRVTATLVDSYQLPPANEIWAA